MILRLFNLYKKEREIQHELREKPSEELLLELKNVQEQIELILESNFDSHWL